MAKTPTPRVGGSLMKMLGLFLGHFSVTTSPFQIWVTIKHLLYYRYTHELTHLPFIERYPLYHSSTEKSYYRSQFRLSTQKLLDPMSAEHGLSATLSVAWTPTVPYRLAWGVFLVQSWHLQQYPGNKSTSSLQASTHPFSLLLAHLLAFEPTI